VFYRIDVTALAPLVACPTLVLHSTRDERVPFDEGRLLANLTSDARFVPLESRNHILLEHEAAWRRWIEEVRAFLPTTSAEATAFARLTSREHELLELIAQGRDNAQIAAALQLSEKTVRNHITHIFTRLEVENRSRAIVLAREAGFGKKPR
jgi:DNA-binding NarL/FixJ family response regulator